MVQLTEKQERLLKRMRSKFNYFFYTLFNVPSAFIAGVKLDHLSGDRCVTSVSYKFLNKNPFRSIYFAVISMAAELSTGCLVMVATEGFEKKIGFIVVDLKASFHSKAKGKVEFICEDGQILSEAVQKCLETGKQTEVKLKTIGKMKDGSVGSEFYFTWTLKVMS